MRVSAPWVVASLSRIAFGAAEPIAVPAARADAQTLQNNAPFSGAVYIVNPDGQRVVSQDTNWCPSSASISCSNMGQPSWCCPANYACVSPANANGLIGCCPSGNTCGGSLNVAQVHTVTVYPPQQTAAVVYAPPPPQTTAVVYAQPPPQTTVHTNPTMVQGGFCATITMAGPGLPRTEQGQCGTILLVSEGAPSLKTLGIGAGVVTIMLHFAVMRMFQRMM